MKSHTKGCIIIEPNMRDSSMPYMDTANNWGEFYFDASEELPPNMSQPKGRNARITVFFDADTPVKWMSKKLKSRRQWKLPHMALNWLQHL